MLAFLRTSITNNYVRALGVLLLGWGLLFLFDASSDQRAYWIGQAIAFGVAALIVVSVLSLIFARLRPYALVAAICVSGVAAPSAAALHMRQSAGFVGVTNAAAAEDAYVSNEFVTDWMSRNRMICAGLNAAKTDCGLVEQVTAADGSTVDVVTYMYASGVKIAAPQRLYVKPNGLCLTIPNIDDYVVSIFQSGNAVAEISESDEPIMLSNDERAELWRVAVGQNGVRAGDELCTRFTVHEQTGNEVHALLQHVWKNGVPAPDNDGVVLRFFKTNTKLPLRDLTPSQ